MIKINISKAKREEVEEKHYQYFKDNFLDKLISLSKVEDSFRDFYRFLLLNIEQIITGRPKELNDVIIKIDNGFPYLSSLFKKGTRQRSGHEKKLINKLNLKNIFNYDAFLKPDPPDWGAYQLTKNLNVNICPYCNRQYIVTYHSEEKKVIRPQLDHFFAKSIYPYLALSLYNLIPSCNICNSRLKRDTEFEYKKYIHPYEEGFGDSMKFSVKIREEKDINNYNDLKYLDFFFGESDEFDIKFKAGKEVNNEFIKKAENNIKVFKLEELYDFHKDNVAELIKKNMIYNKDRIKELYQNFNQLFNSKDDIVRMIVSNYITEDNLDKRVLAKLTKDICEELNLFDYT